MSAPLVFFDIAGPDQPELKDFYASVFGWRIGEDGKFSTTVMSPLDSAIRQDPAEMRLYVGVPDVSEALDRIEAHGGKTEQARFEVPGVVILGLFRDPAGNPLGLVELDGDDVKIP